MADNVQSATPTSTSDGPKAAPSRAGGLLRARPKEMTPVFAVLMTVMTLDFLLLLCLPYAIADGTDSPWGDTPRLGFLGFAMLSGLIFGTFSAVIAEQRNHSAWWFLAGHIGVIAAPIMAALGMADDSGLIAKLVTFALGFGGTLAAMMVVSAYPRDSFREPAPMTRALGRMWHACGNIWFGIALLIVLAAAWHLGTWWEDAYGHRSAQYRFYGAGWFGALMLVFTLSIISATLRKYPWRVEQTGWIVTHIALVMLSVGSFMSFFGKVEGMMPIIEGEESAHFNLDVETRLVVQEARGRAWAPVWSGIVNFDRDPSQTEVDETFSVTEAGNEIFQIKVDRFFGDAYQESQQTDEGAEPLFGVAGTYGIGESRSEFLVVAERGKALQTIGPSAIFAYPAAWPQIIEGFKGGRDEINVGTVVVKDADGKVLLRKTVKPGARPQGMEAAPAELDGLKEKIPGTDITIEGVAWYDNFTVSDPRRDLTPGFPAFPTVLVKLDGKSGEGNRVAAAFDPSWSHEPSLIKDDYKNIRVEFEYLPGLPLQSGAIYLAKYGDDAPIWAMARSDGTRAHGKLVEGRPLDLGIPLQITPTKIFSNYFERKWYEFNKHDPDRQTARLQVDGEERWLQIGGAIRHVKDDRQFRIQWTPTRQNLGFSLKLTDFHRDFYAGSSQAKTYESYLALTHENKYPDPVNIKIDMNHPLRLDGWRLFQSRFGATPTTEMTYLQVNRDPGLAVTYPACIVLLLGLVIVFTQKKHYLKAIGKRLRADGANAQRTFINALMPVLLALAATMPGVLLIIFVPEGPLLGLGVVLIVAGLFLETWWVNCRLAPKWIDQSSTKTGAAS